jgi:hypothetical protein
MQITAEQIRAAEAQGCRFEPASERQVRTLSMQRRIFWQGTQALVALRQDGFLETAATLQQILEQPAPEEPSTPLPPREPEPASISPAESVVTTPPAASPAPTLAATAQMVAAVVAARSLEAADLPDLIRSVHGSVSRLLPRTGKS